MNPSDSEEENFKKIQDISKCENIKKINYNNLKKFSDNSEKLSSNDFKDNSQSSTSKSNEIENFCKDLTAKWSELLRYNGTEKNVIF